VRDHLRELLRAFRAGGDLRPQVSEILVDVARRIQSVLSREEALLDRKASNLAEDLGEARKAAEYGHKGELLKGVLHIIHEVTPALRRRTMKLVKR
jgi:predicted ribosome quality control (RQC) complex YloA/Tae2 family protein